MFTVFIFVLPHGLKPRKLCNLAISVGLRAFSNFGTKLAIVFVRQKCAEKCFCTFSSNFVQHGISPFSMFERFTLLKWKSAQFLFCMKGADSRQCVLTSSEGPVRLSRVVRLCSMSAGKWNFRMAEGILQFHYSAQAWNHKEGWWRDPGPKFLVVHVDSLIKWNHICCSHCNLLPVEVIWLKHCCASWPLWGEQNYIHFENYFWITRAMIWPIRVP